jgi:mono/diheme cytochrome c family protein
MRDARATAAAPEREMTSIGFRAAVTLVPVALALALALALAACAPSERSQQEAAAAHRATIARFCFDCHDDIERMAGLSLESLDLSDVGADAASWEHVVRKLRTGMMPPHDGGPRPSPEQRAALVDWLEDELDLAAAAAPNPGRTVPFHRLNRSEYHNAVRDLLAVDVDVDDLLPGDDLSYGFDNIGGVLKLSPTLLERYLGAAEEISRLAVGTPAPFVAFDSFRVPDDRSQERRLPGLPFGTRGGLRIDYTFPEDAEYLISAELARDLNESLPMYPEPQMLEISIDRQRVATFTLVAPERPATEGRPGRLSREQRAEYERADEDWTVRVPVKAGRREVIVSFVENSSALVTQKREPFLYPFPRGFNMAEQRTGAYLRRVEISGPYDATGPGSTASRERIFLCRPDAPQPGPTAESLDCAATIITSLARRAFRRPVADADIEPLLGFYRAGHDETGSFDGGIRVALKALLVSPEFLFRAERDPPDAAPGTPYRISDLELASRLSFFLWSSIPDDELLDAAERGMLREPAELEQQVRRMIADPRADAFVDNFAGQWLHLRNLDAAAPVQKIFPNFDDTLRQGLRRETELFFASVLREDRSVLDLLDADYTFLNERVARHYGIPGITGAHFRRVELPPGSPRGGLLGQGSVLTVTSQPDRTSPVLRGKWVLENLLGAAPPSPPANVPPLEATNVTDGTGRMLSLRERLAAHRSNPNCASCHTLMDSLGFALEGFDAVGRARGIDELGERIDTSGILPNGESFVGIEEFRAALVRSDLFPSVLAEKLLVYAMGRGLEPYDMPAVRAIVRRGAAADNRFSQFILGVVESAPFQMRRSAL